MYRCTSVTEINERADDYDHLWSSELAWWRLFRLLLTSLWKVSCFLPHIMLSWIPWHKNTMNTSNAAFIFRNITVCCLNNLNIFFTVCVAKFLCLWIFVGSMWEIKYIGLENFSIPMSKNLRGHIEVKVWRRGQNTGVFLFLFFFWKNVKLDSRVDCRIRNSTLRGFYRLTNGWEQ